MDEAALAVKTSVEKHFPQQIPAAADTADFACWTGRSFPGRRICLPTETAAGRGCRRSNCQSARSPHPTERRRELLPPGKPACYI